MYIRPKRVGLGIQFIEPMISSWFERRINHMGYGNNPALRQQWRILGNVRKH